MPGVIVDIGVGTPALSTILAAAVHALSLSLSLAVVLRSCDSNMHYTNICVAAASS